MGRGPTSRLIVAPNAAGLEVRLGPPEKTTCRTATMALKLMEVAKTVEILMQNDGVRLPKTGSEEEKRRWRGA